MICFDKSDVSNAMKSDVFDTEPMVGVLFACNLERQIHICEST